MEDKDQNASLKALLRASDGIELFCALLSSFPYPVQVFGPDGIMMMANAAFIREFHIQDPDMIIGKYNLLNDPTLSQYGALDNVRNAFAGKLTTAGDFKVPVHVVKKTLNIPVDEVEAIYQDITTIPLMDQAGKLICVVNILVTKRASTSRAEINQAMQFIEDHWLGEFNVNEVAKAVHLSPAHFSRMFKEYTDMTPREYYVSYKLDRLKERLIDSNLSIAQAFETCGLHYHSHYAKLFKKKTGLSPSEYRKNANI